jgi:hypothetical protein
MANPLEKVEIKFVGDSTSLTKAIESLDKATKKLLNTQAKIVDFNKKQQKSTNSNRNALRKLTNQLALQGAGYKDLGLSLGTFRRALKGSNIDLLKIKKATQEHISVLKKQENQLKKNEKGLFELGHSARQTGGAFSVLRSQLLLFNFALSLGIRQLVRFTTASSKVESMSTAFKTLSGGTENASIAIEKLEKATNNTMSQFDLFQQANNAMILGVTKNSDEMAEMFDIAQRLGQALGRDTASSIESLVTGIGRQSRLMLDNIGIIVRSQEAYADYANQLGIAEDKLTDTQKKQAFLNATMTSARLLARLLNPEVENTQMIFGQLEKATADLSVEIGRSLTPLLESSAKLLTSFMQNIDAEDVSRFGRAIISVATAYGIYKTAVLAATVATNGFTISLKKNPVGALTIAFSAITFALLEYRSKMKEGAEITEEASKKIQDQEAVVHKLQEEIKELINAKESENDIIERNTKIRDENIKKIKSTSQSLANELLALQLEKAELQGVSDTHLGMLELRIKGLNNLTEAQKKVILEIAKTKGEIENLKQSQKDQEESEKRLTEQAKEAAEVRKEIFGETLDFQLNQLDALRDKFIKHYGEVEEAEKIFQERAIKITEDFNKNKNAKELNELKNLQKAKNEIYSNNLQFQLDLLDQEFEKYKELNINKADVDLAYEERKKELVIKNLEETNGFYNAFEASYGTFINSLTDMDMSRKEREQQILESGKNAFISFFGEILKEKIKSILVEKVINKSAQATTIASAKVTSSAIASFYATAAALASTATAGASAITGAVALTNTVGVAKGLATVGSFEEGGLVGGRRHSQGGTIIEAERGEFVMSRSAVQSVGLETMNKINEGKSTGDLTINVSAPLVDETILDVIIPKIQQAQRQNLA